MDGDASAAASKAPKPARGFTDLTSFFGRTTQGKAAEAARGAQFAKLDASTAALHAAGARRRRAPKKIEVARRCMVLPLM